MGCGVSESRLSGGMLQGLHLFNVANKDYLDLWGELASLAQARVLEMLCLHKEEFHMLLDTSLLGKRKLNLATGYCDLLWCGKSWGTRLCGPGVCMGKRGKQSYSYTSQDKISKLWTRLDPTLDPGLFPITPWVSQPHSSSHKWSQGQKSCNNLKRCRRPLTKSNIPTSRKAWVDL